MSFAKSQLRALLPAIGFLSRLPVPMIDNLNAMDQARSALYYPVVGLLFGLILLALAHLFSPVEPLLLAALLVMVWAMLSGALHLDGLADSADAWLGGLGDRNKSHAILKDPLVGSAGAAALTIIILFKYSALYAIIKQNNYMAIAFAPIVGRSFILLLFASTEYVRQQGLVSDILRYFNGRAAVVICVLVLLSGIWLSWTGALFAFLTFLALRSLMIKRLGGYTGDTAGASVEISEAFWLFGATLL